MAEISTTQIEVLAGIEELSEGFLEYHQFIYELKSGTEAYKVRLFFKQKTHFITIEVFSKQELRWNQLLQISTMELTARRATKENFGYYVEGDEKLLLEIAKKILF